MGREIKFKPATFYLGIADHLARVVEGQEAPAAAPASELSSEVRSRPEQLARETSGEREDRERGEMADSLQKGTAEVTSPNASSDATSALGGIQEPGSQIVEDSSNAETSGKGEDRAAS